MFNIGKLRSISDKFSKAPERDAAAADAEFLGTRIAKLNAAKPGQLLPATQERTVETRQAERFLPRWTATYLTTKTGKKLDARIVNVSMVSVAIDADFSQVNPESIVMVGSRPVEKGRRIMSGMVFLFEKPLDKSSCGPDLVL